MASLDAADPQQPQQLRHRFIAKAQDLLLPYLPADKVAIYLHVFYTLLSDDQGRWDEAPLWQESGRGAIEALIGGLDSDSARSGLRRWAELVEPLLRRCWTLVPKPGNGPAGKEDAVEDLSKILKKAKLVPEAWPERFSSNPKDQPEKKRRPCLLAAARAEQPTSDDTSHLTAFLAKDRRNNYAHGQWPALAWRDRIETVEAILLTCVRMIERHPEIERHAIYACARDHAPSTQPSPDFGWTWEGDGARHCCDSTDGFADALLKHVWQAQPRLCVIGERGVGLSTLGAAVARCSVRTDGSDTHSFFLIGKASEFERLSQAAPEQAASLDIDAFMKELLGVDWSAWWVQRALDGGWLGVVVDDLDGLGTEALRRLVFGLEAVRKKHPTLRMLTLRPPILPASRDRDRPDVLGKLGVGKTIWVLGRGMAEAAPGRWEPGEVHPSHLGFWLAKGAADGVDKNAPDAVLDLLVGSLRHDLDNLWIDYDPACRKATAVVALNALARIAGALDEADRDDDTLPSLGDVEYLKCLDEAFAEVAEWEGAKAAPTAQTEDLRKAVREALKDTGLVCEPTRHLGYRIALPSIEQCVTSRGYPSDIRRRWDELQDDQRDALIAAYGTRGNNPRQTNR